MACLARRPARCWHCSGRHSEPGEHPPPRYFPRRVRNHEVAPDSVPPADSRSFEFTSRHLQRSDGRIPPSTCSTCAPQPVKVGRLHVPHSARRHIRHPPLLRRGRCSGCRVPEPSGEGRRVLRPGGRPAALQSTPHLSAPQASEWPGCGTPRRAQAQAFWARKFRKATFTDAWIEAGTCSRACSTCLPASASSAFFP